VGAILIGDGPLVPIVAQAFSDGGPLAARRSELLFPLPIDLPAATPDQMPDTAQVCDCNAVSKAQIVDAVLKGASSLQAVCAVTRAGTGCGSCRPEVQKIVEMACRSVEAPELLTPQPVPDPAPVSAANEERVVVTLTKIERIKKEKDGLDIIPDIPMLAQGGWEAISEADRERLKWAGVFFRRQTPGRFMMRLRIPNGFTNVAQMRAIADVAEEFGTAVIDITTRQQVQIRGFKIDHVPAIVDRLESVGLLSLQTGMDNIRNVIGCAVAGLTPGELFDASPVVREFTNMFVRDKAFTNLPRKFNVGISGCTEHCTHAESQDLALTPAVKTIAGQKRSGFNVAVGGKMGSGGCKLATPLDIFVEPDDAAPLCREIVLLFRDHGSRAARNRARLSFLLEAWGTDRFRREVEQRAARTLEGAGRDARIVRSADHIGIHKQKQPGLNYAGLLVAVGRVPAPQLREVARAASQYGNGEIRFTTSQNVIIPNVPDNMLAALAADPLLPDLPHDPHGAMRGLVACTGIDYCHFALIETKELAVVTARELARRLPHGQRVTTHWSGCSAGCGNHAAADIGLLGKNVRVNGEMIEAVDVFVGGRAGPNARAGVKMLEDVPCDQLPTVLEALIPYVTGKRGTSVSPIASSFTRSTAAPSPPEYANS
jgi:ferredoxin-nitrite reductase